MSESTQAGDEVRREEPVNEVRVRLYEQLMEAQERIAQLRYAGGVDDAAVVAALDAAETGISEQQRREDLYLASLAAYVAALGGRLEVRAVFGDESVVVRTDPLAQPAWVERLLEERRRSGAGRRDEVWEGVLHMIPPPSVEHERLAHRLHVLLDPYASTVDLVAAGTVGIGTEDDYRVSDLALLRPGYAPQWNRTAALIVEVVSPRDNTSEKLPFYAAHRVDEAIIVDAQGRKIHWFGLQAAGGYRPLERSRLLGVSSDEFAAHLGWA